MFWIFDSTAYPKFLAVFVLLHQDGDFGREIGVMIFIDKASEIFQSFKVSKEIQRVFPKKKIGPFLCCNIELCCLFPSCLYIHLALTFCRLQASSHASGFDFSREPCL